MDTGCWSNKAFAFKKQKKNSDRAVIVEFFGLPGSGKTAVHDIINQRLIDKGLDVASQEELIQWLRNHLRLFKASLALKRPIWAFICLFYCIGAFGFFAFKNKYLFTRIVSTISSTVYLKNFLIKRKPDIFLLDQYTVQNIWSTWVGRKIPDTEILSRIIKHSDSYIGRKYIFFESDPKSVSKRIANRNHGTSRFDGYDADTIEKMLLPESNLMNDILDAVRFKGNDLLIIDALKTPEESADIVMDWLNLAD
jgi:hypothetical protein